MNREEIYFQINQIISKEYQSLWLIKLDDLSIEVVFDNKLKAAPDSVAAAKKLLTYNEARKWYIENYVVEHSRERLLTQTAVDYILTELLSGESFFIEYGRLSEGRKNFNQLCYDKVVNADGKIEYLVMGFRSIDNRRNAEVDDVTGLLTRGGFFKKAEELLKDYPDKQFDIVISDIIDFKKINETYGSDIADDILRWHGTYLLSLINDNMIIGRYGGDQMVIFGTHEQVMDCLTDTKRDKFLQAERENGLPSITIKYGIYFDVKHNRSILSTCDKAHMALNSIKRHYSKDVAYYNDEIRNHLERQRRIEDSMHESLRNGDFKVYYQPKHNARTGELVGAEALVRWIHPEYGFMSPADFIPLFEQNGFIVENDKFVWRRTCENLKRWQERGIKTVPISINSSRLTMVSEDLVSDMKNAVDSHGLSPSQLHLEITETLMEENTEEMIKKLNEIRALGFKVELDDFGSGYSSLNVLSELPLDIVKLDMSFMQQFGDRKRSMVLESCIDLAKKLGFQTVSEGVEEKVQQELLGKLGVDMIQGYYYSKPLPENEFEIYLMQHLPV